MLPYSGKPQCSTELARDGNILRTIDSNLFKNRFSPDAVDKIRELEREYVRATEPNAHNKELFVEKKYADVKLIFKNSPVEFDAHKTVLTKASSFLNEYLSQSTHA